MGLEAVLYSNREAIFTPMKVTTNKLERSFKQLELEPYSPHSCTIYPR
jgi:hypothetical protein